MSSKARLVITAVVVEKRPVAQVVRDYDVSRSWVYELLARYRTEGERVRAALPPTSEFRREPPHPRPSNSCCGYASNSANRAVPSSDARTGDSHDRVRTDKIDKTACVTLRVAGKLRHIGIGRPHAGTHVTLLIHDLHVRVINAATGKLLRELQIDPTRDYQPRGRGTPK